MFDKPFVSAYILPEVLFLVEVSGDKRRILQSIRLDLPKGLIKNYVVTDTSAFSQMLAKIWSTYRLKEKNVAIILSEFAAFTKVLSLPKVSYSEMHEAVLWAMQEYFPEDSENMLFDWKIISQDDKTVEVFVVAARKVAIESITDSFKNAGILPFFVETPSISLARLDEKKKGGTLIVYQDKIVSLVVSLKEGNVLGSSVLHGDDPAALFSTAKKMSTHYNTVTLQSLYFSGYSKELYENLEKAFGLIPKPLLKDQDVKDDAQAISHNDYVIPFSLATSKLSPPSDPYSINLLPLEYVENYTVSTKKVQLWGLLLTVTLFVWISLFACLGTYLFITQTASSLKSSNASTSQEQKRADTANLVKQINATTDSILSIKSVTVIPQEILNMLEMSEPSGISIAQYKFDFDLGDIKIDGVAKDRLALIEFKQNLQKNDKFGSIDIPISNFETETDLAFTLSAKYLPISKNVLAKPGQLKKTTNP